MKLPKIEIFLKRDAGIRDELQTGYHLSLTVICLDLNLIETGDVIVKELAQKLNSSHSAFLLSYAEKMDSP